MKLFLRGPEKVQPLRPRPIQSEDELQRLLKDHPDLLPGNLDSKRAVVREFPTPAGPIDHLALDARGEILVVETKLLRNADHRQAVAQVIDYASRLYRFGPQEFLDKVRDILGYDFLEEWFPEREAREEFRRNFEENLRLSQLTLAVVMDRADDRLKDAVRFLNRSSAFKCLIAEVSVWDADGREFVGVETYGEESAEGKPAGLQRAGRPEKEPITDERFVALLAAREREGEAREFLKAVRWLEGQGVDVARTPRNIIVPRCGLYWEVNFPYIYIWAMNEEKYAARKAHLEAAPEPWRSRTRTRNLAPGRQGGRVAIIETQGATEADFRGLLEFCAQGP